MRIEAPGSRAMESTATRRGSGHGDSARGPLDGTRAATRGLRGSGDGESPPPASQSGALDDTGDGTDAGDLAETTAEALTRRSERMLLAVHAAAEERQARLDRMKSDFDGNQAVRAELMREMNVLRDMALEQMKKDDEFLKKLVSLI